MTGWFAHPRPFAFEVDNYEAREDIFRFANGTPAIPALYAVQPGVEIIAQVGIDAIRAKSIRQTSMLVELAQAAGYAVNSPLRAHERAGTVTINPPEAYAVSRALLARGIVIDYREGAGIRAAPHFYTTDEETRAVIDGIVEILADGSWKPYAEQRAFVT